MKTVNVAVGVIVKGEKILLSLRHQQQHQGGKWEFPGGKIEAQESVVEALARELQEELLINIAHDSCEPLIRIEHDYGDKRVCLHVYTVKRFSGEPKGAEQQEIRWVDKAKLADYQFPAANQAILQAIQQREL
ncbi:8-oxo-dGTP diphosphatase MutT [Agarivorans sp. MS3-6]